MNDAKVVVTVEVLERFRVMEGNLQEKENTVQHLVAEINHLRKTNERLTEVLLAMTRGQEKWKRMVSATHHAKG